MNDRRSGRHDSESSAKQDQPPPIAGKAKDLEVIRTAMVDAAGVSAGLWFSYLFVLLYLLIAAGSVTHRALLFESPVKLPFLNVDLPLLGFFILGPALFIVAHAYVLLHFSLLAAKVGAFHSELRHQVGDPNTRMELRRQLPSNIFVQILSGPREVRTGVLGALLWLVAWISLVIGPVALLVFFQFQFLPYHDEAITWWHRTAVILDLLLLWTLWPSVALGRTTMITWRDFRHAKVAAAALASLMILILVLTTATIPGEFLNRKGIWIRFIPQYVTIVRERREGPTGERLVTTAETSLRWITLQQFLVEGLIDPVSGKITSPWSNRLILPYLDGVPEGLSLRARHLEGAVFFSANMRKVDFTAAQLDDAMFNNADLREANFSCAKPLGTSHGTSYWGQQFIVRARHCVTARNASFVSAQLQRASFDDASLPGASFVAANIEDTGFDRASLAGAQLSIAKGRYARFNDARLEGSILLKADLRDAQFANAHLQKAFMLGADLTGANLQGAELVGADLRDASLNCANLTEAGRDGRCVGAERDLAE
ncbi:MAG: pentapeptide repeat-containing protein [Alphaproteobacteria bacterium]